MDYYHLLCESCLQHVVYIILWIFKSFIVKNGIVTSMKWLYWCNKYLPCDIGMIYFWLWIPVTHDVLFRSVCGRLIFRFLVISCWIFTNNSFHELKWKLHVLLVMQWKLRKIAKYLKILLNFCSCFFFALFFIISFYTCESFFIFLYWLESKIKI